MVSIFVLTLISIFIIVIVLFCIIQSVCSIINTFRVMYYDREFYKHLESIKGKYVLCKYTNDCDDLYYVREIHVVKNELTSISYSRNLRLAKVFETQNEVIEYIKLSRRDLFYITL